MRLKHKALEPLHLLWWGPDLAASLEQAEQVLAKTSAEAEEFDRLQGEAATLLDAKVRGVLGTTPIDRLRWLLDRLVYPVLDVADPAALLSLSRALELLIREETRTEWAAFTSWITVERVALDDHEALLRLPDHQRRYLAAMRRAVKKRDFKVNLGFWAIPRDDVREAQREASSAIRALVDGSSYTKDFGTVIFRATAKHHSFQASAADAVVVAIRALVARVPGNLLRWCPYSAHKQHMCRRIFVATRRQKWCAEHREVVRRDQLRAAQERHRKKARRDRRRKR